MPCRLSRRRCITARLYALNHSGAMLDHPEPSWKEQRPLSPRGMCTQSCCVASGLWRGRYPAMLFAFLPLAMILRPVRPRARTLLHERMEEGWCQRHSSPGADVARVSRVPVQMWQRRARSQSRRDRGEPRPSADVGRGEPSPGRCRCGRGEPGAGSDMAAASPVQSCKHPKAQTPTQLWQVWAPFPRFP